jgi:PIN domain nuclease of toxin-antitoxin system
MHHRDPFDRVLVAQALMERLPIITADARFGEYGVEVRW